MANVRNIFKDSGETPVTTNDDNISPSLNFDETEYDASDDDEYVDDDQHNEFLNNLLNLKQEIDDILQNMGYGEDEYVDDDEYSDDDYEDDDYEDDEYSDDYEDDESFDDEHADDYSDDRVDSEYVDSRDEDYNDSEGSDQSQLNIDDYASNFDDNDNFDDNEEDIEDQNFQGNIRTVSGANLVYKRKSDDGNYEELWIYNVGNDIRQESQIRRAILAGTDIAPNQRESEDGTQEEETTTVGNVQFLRITGLPN